jgi:hypothetical protein
MTAIFKTIGAVAVALCLAKPAAAETIGYADAMDMLMAACGNDVDAHCGDVRLGSGRIEACLAQHSGNVSPQCTATSAQVIALLQARAQAQAAVPELCKHDIQKLCSNFRAGNARVLNCLIRRDNVRKVSRKCNEAITNAGWR